MDINETFKQLAEYKRMREELDGLIDGLQDEIKAYMKEAHTDLLTGEEHKATYKAFTARRLDTNALKGDLPDVVAKYTRPCITMRFSFS